MIMKAATGVPVVRSYAPPPQNQLPSGTFSTGLCDCCSNMSLCCLTFWCPCITFGRISEIVDKGSSSCGVSGTLYTLLMCFTGCHWIYSCTYRSKMKAQYGIPEDCRGDCCSQLCCECCALCQEYRELEQRGYNVALAWQGNNNTGSENNAMPMPQVPAGMMR